jgi:hypothetical protein
MAPPFPLIHSNSGPPRMECWDANQQTQVKNVDNLFHRSPGLCGHIHPDVHWSVLSTVPSGVLRSSFPTGKIAYLRPDRVCVIGVKEMASIPLLTYDVFLNIFLTSLFVYPLLRHTITNAGLRALAKRTCLCVVIKALQSFT